MFITENGKKALTILGHEVNPSHRKGGIENEYWKKKMAEHFRQKGYRVIEEYSLGEGKSVDLVAIKDNEKIAIEIETGKSDAIYNIGKDLEAGFDKVICITLNKNFEEKIKNKLRKLNLGEITRVKLWNVGSFVSLKLTLL